MPEAPFQKIWKVGEPVLAADLNTSIRDGYNYPLKDKPQARAHNTAAQTIPNVTWTNCFFSTEQYDTSDNTRSQFDRMDIVVPGLYLVTGNVSFAGTSGAGGRAMRFTVSGNPYGGVAGCAAAPSGQNTALSLTRLIYLAKSEILRIQAYQDSGGGCAIQTGFDEVTCLQVVWVTSATAIR